MGGTRVGTCAVLVLTLVSLLSDAVDAHQWRMTPTAQARDYTQIVDHRLKGEARQPLRDGALPPAVTGIIATLQAAYSQALGALGQGTEWYVFEGKGIDSCQKGAFWIYSAGEQYGYATPIPGCGQSTAGSPQG